MADFLFSDNTCFDCSAFIHLVRAVHTKRGFTRMFTESTPLFVTDNTYAPKTGIYGSLIERFAWWYEPPTECFAGQVVRTNIGSMYICRQSFSDGPHRWGEQAFWQYIGEHYTPYDFSPLHNTPGVQNDNPQSFDSSTQRRWLRITESLRVQDFIHNTDVTATRVWRLNRYTGTPQAVSASFHPLGLDVNGVDWNDFDVWNGTFPPGLNKYNLLIGVANPLELTRYDAFVLSAKVPILSATQRVRQWTLAQGYYVAGVGWTVTNRAAAGFTITQSWTLDEEYMDDDFRGDVDRLLASGDVSNWPSESAVCDVRFDQAGNPVVGARTPAVMFNPGTGVGGWADFLPLQVSNMLVATAQRGVIRGVGPACIRTYRNGVQVSCQDLGLPCEPVNGGFGPDWHDIRKITVARRNCL